jgi:hypothetical protein
MDLQPFVGPWPRLQFRNYFYTDGRTPWIGDQPVARTLPTHKTTKTSNKSTHRHPCLRVRIEPMISAFERAKIFHALDFAATVIGVKILESSKYIALSRSGIMLSFLL